MIEKLAESNPTESLLTFIAALVEGHDPDLSGHQQRVAIVSRKLAERAGCTADEIVCACIGAQVHDLGKLSISNQVLNKPGRLTRAEFTLVQQHAAIGYEQIRVLDLDPRIGEIVYSHHENFDGTGYPCRLAGTAIPLLARIARITDTFDAVTMDRPYHKGVSDEEALEILSRSARCYDPDLMSEFPAVVAETRAA